MDVRTVAELGTLVRERRLAQGLTQAALADRARVGTKFVIRLEQGHPTIEIAKVFDVLAALGISLVAQGQERHAASESSQKLLDAVFDNLGGGRDL